MSRLDGARFGNNVDNIDPERVSELIGGEEGQRAQQLEDLEQDAGKAGYLDARAGDGVDAARHPPHRPEGAARHVREFLKDAFGGPRLDRTGRGGDREETSKPFEFGDPFHLDLRATMTNALMREEKRRRAGRAGSSVTCGRTTSRCSAPSDDVGVTVLLVDMSRSMLLRGCYLAAKRVAIALDTLIRTQFPRDHLAIVGFAYYARELRPEALAELDWNTYEYGTNLQHGLMLARKILASHHAANSEIVVITDGEPTAHFEDGQVEFSYPPTRRTIQETLREVVRCTKEGSPSTRSCSSGRPR